MTSHRPDQRGRSGGDPAGAPWFVRLDEFDNGSFPRGRGKLVEALWLFISAVFVQSPLPGSKLRVSCLRAFGAQIGPGVVIKPRVTVKFPWKLSIGAHTWIGEEVWIDNLDQVTIGSQCCLSQGAFLCTGSHDWSKARFDLITRPIIIEDESWICAKASVALGVRVGRGAVLGFGAVAATDLTPWTVHIGGPLPVVKPRRVRG